METKGAEAENQREWYKPLPIFLSLKMERSGAAGFPSVGAGNGAMQTIPISPRLQSIGDSISL